MYDVLLEWIKNISAILNTVLPTWTVITVIGKEKCIIALAPSAYQYHMSQITCSIDTTLFHCEERHLDLDFSRAVARAPLKPSTWRSRAYHMQNCKLFLKLSSSTLVALSCRKRILSFLTLRCDTEMWKVIRSIGPKISFTATCKSCMIQLIHQNIRPLVLQSTNTP